MSGDYQEIRRSGDHLLDGRGVGEHPGHVAVVQLAEQQAGPGVEADTQLPDILLRSEITNGSCNRVFNLKVKINQNLESVCTGHYWAALYCFCFHNR